MLPGKVQNLEDLQNADFACLHMKWCRLAQCCVRQEIESPAFPFETGKNPPQNLISRLADRARYAVPNHLRDAGSQ